MFNLKSTLLVVYSGLNLHCKKSAKTSRHSTKCRETFRENNYDWLFIPGIANKKRLNFQLLYPNFTCILNRNGRNKTLLTEFKERKMGKKCFQFVIKFALKV